jgi:hyperosmotically inducible protein
MTSKPAVAGAALALVFAVSGCNQTTPPSNIAPGPSSVATPAAPPAEFQAATPSSSARSPGPAETTGREVGEALDDATVTTKVKAALLEAPDVKGMDVKVETEKSVVQLSGFVASQAQIDKAVEVAKGVRGVREVQNKMSVKPG